MAEPEVLLCDRIAEVVLADFGVTVEHDRYPRAAGKDGERAVGVSSTRAGEMPRQVNVLVVEAELQWYEAYTAEPDEFIVVDPREIEATGGALRRAFADTSGGDSNDLWYLRLTRIEYPVDPTGNKSRLEAHFTAWAHNTAALGA